jgi:hypothetical protein
VSRHITGSFKYHHYKLIFDQNMLLFECKSMKGRVVNKKHIIVLIPELIHI